MVLVFLLLLSDLPFSGLISVCVLGILGAMVMRMNVLMLVAVNQVPVTMFMGVFVRVLMHVFTRCWFLFCHCNLLS